MRPYVSIIFLLIQSIALLAQTGPGGVGDSTTNGLWLRTDILTLNDSDSVALWPDASGNNNDAFQLDTSMRPVFYQTSTLNSLPIIRLDGVNDVLTVADATILDGTPGITFYAVLRPNNLDGEPRGILGKRIDSSTNANWAYTWFFYTTDRIFLDINTQNDRFSTGSETYSNATNYILGWDYYSVLPGTQRSRLRNGSDTVVTSRETSTSVLNSNQPITIGAMNPNYGRYLGADYAEIIHYNEALDRSEHVLIQNYLSAKYNIPLNTNNYYDEDDTLNGNFDFDVAGIGNLVGNITDNARGSGIIQVLNPHGLSPGEFYIWGRDTGLLGPVETVDVPLGQGVEARFKRIWRGSMTGTIDSFDLRIDLSGLGSVVTSDLRLLVDMNGNGAFSDETAGVIGGATSLGAGIYEFTDVSELTDGRRFTFGTVSVGRTPLPVTLKSFQAYQRSDGNSVHLKWVTLSEINNAKFIVERSSDLQSWKPIREIEGAGNSPHTRLYETIDKHPLNGTSYYRIKQVDFDGGVHYSQMEAINRSNLPLVKVFPNPADRHLTVRGLAGLHHDIRIFDMLSSDCTPSVQINLLQNGEIDINVQRLKAGLYVVHIGNEHFKFIKK
ncbi:MAG: hypothetical protein Salg2KO_02650 [Salibacteraceae bacterium]